MPCEFENCRTNTTQVNHDFCFRCKREQEYRVRRALAFLEEAERESEERVEDELTVYRKSERRN